MLPPAYPERHLLGFEYRTATKLCVGGDDFQAEQQVHDFCLALYCGNFILF